MEMKALNALNHTPPWEWPEDAGEIILRVLVDKYAEDADRILAAELAGDEVVMDDELADALLEVVAREGAGEDLRAAAAISLGPALELADTMGFEDADESVISETAFERIRQSLCDLYLDPKVPDPVRRAILEASVRAPQEWHHEAVRAVYAGGAEAWKLTAAFCMRFVPDFDDEILECLKSDDPNIHYQAVCAAGNWGVEAAWAHVAKLASARDTDKPLRLAAIDAVASIRPEEAQGILGDLTLSDDEDIAEAAHEALAMAGDFPEWLDPDEEDDENEEKEQ